MPKFVGTCLSFPGPTATGASLTLNGSAKRITNRSLILRLAIKILVTFLQLRNPNTVIITKVFPIKGGEKKRVLRTVRIHTITDPLLVPKKGCVLRVVVFVGAVSHWGQSQRCALHMIVVSCGTCSIQNAENRQINETKRNQTRTSLQECVGNIQNIGKGVCRSEHAMEICGLNVKLCLVEEIETKVLTDGSPKEDENVASRQD